MTSNGTSSDILIPPTAVQPSTILPVTQPIRAIPRPELGGMRYSQTQGTSSTGSPSSTKTKLMYDDFLYNLNTDMSKVELFEKGETPTLDDRYMCYSNTPFD